MLIVKLAQQERKLHRAGAELIADQIYRNQEKNKYKQSVRARTLAQLVFNTPFENAYYAIKRADRQRKYNVHSFSLCIISRPLLSMCLIMTCVLK